MNAKTTAERQEAFRARRAMLEGATEVRGIYLRPELHSMLKQIAKQLAEQENPAQQPK